MKQGPSGRNRPDGRQWNCADDNPLATAPANHVGAGQSLVGQAQGSFHFERFEILLLAALPGTALERAGKRGKLGPENTKHAVRRVRGAPP